MIFFARTRHSGGFEGSVLHSGQAVYSPFSKTVVSPPILSARSALKRVLSALTVRRLSTKPSRKSSDSSKRSLSAIEPSRSVSFALPWANTRLVVWL